MDFHAIEAKWRRQWEEKHIFKPSSGKKCYVLEMFPYPSASGLHNGHALNYTIGDIYARYKRMQGYSVLYPMGYDAFGLPAENAAIKAGEHPASYTEKSIKNYMDQQKALGLSYDWSRKIVTCQPDYYKWNQYFFIKLYEQGLVYRKQSAVNWCSQCNTVLANEQVHAGKCWRHETTDVEIKHLEQWFIKTTAYTEELLADIEKLEWPARIKTMQEHWIGKSEGTQVTFEINKKPWMIFTTRIDTIFGATFMVVAAQHSQLHELVTPEQKPAVDAFLKKLKNVSEKDAETLEKEGVFTGSYAVNPFTHDSLPVYAGNFVIADYGSGMVMAVPAHDQRDYDFAKKYKIPIKTVIEPITGVIRENEEKRNSIVAILENPKTGKILSLNWGSLGGNLFIGGGREEKEDPVECAVREILEETGYKHVKHVGTTEKIHHHYYAASKNVYRDITATGLHFELIDDARTSQKLEDNEKNKFAVEWISKEEADERVVDGLHHYVFEKFLNPAAYTDDGILVDSGEFTGLSSADSREKITEYLRHKGTGNKTFNYKFRDWLVSRQRYWGTPIPMIYCDACGIQPVPLNELPILLPKDITFGKGNPLASSKAFVETHCPACKKPARRETDTMDTFFDSSWYYLRYCDNNNTEAPFTKESVAAFMPVDQYIGGAEHACMHLIYARFFTKALRDMGFLSFEEPFPKLFNQGMLHGSDGNKMSKSLGNVVNPIETIEKYSADSLRFALMSLAAPDSDSIWNDNSMESTHRFLTRVANWLVSVSPTSSTKQVKHKIHSTIKTVSQHIENFKYNLALIQLRELFEYLEKEPISREDVEVFIRLLHPFCPFMTEEAWHVCGNGTFVSLAPWPITDETHIDPAIDAAEEIIMNTIDDIRSIKRRITITSDTCIKKPNTVASINTADSIKTTESSNTTGSIILIVAAHWKYDFYSRVKAEFGKNHGDIIKALMQTELKVHGQEMTKILPGLLKNPGKMPALMLGQAREYQALVDAQERISKTFNADIQIVLAEQSSEQKANVALPGKPAILLR